MPGQPCPTQVVRPLRTVLRRYRVEPGVCHDDGVARFLIVVVPLVARVWPAVAIGDELLARGHEVAFCGPEQDLRPLVGPGPTIFATGKRSYRPTTQLGTAAIRELWDEYMVPLNRFIQGPVDRAVACYQPDVVLSDQYALAGTLAAIRSGIRWATLCTGALDLTPPADDGSLRDFVGSRLDRLRDGTGVTGVDGSDLLFSPDLVIATTVRALTGPVPLPRQCVLVGAALGARRTDPGFDWNWWDAGRRHVLVTAGTLSAHWVQDFTVRVLTALEPMRATVQVVLNAATSPVPEAPPHLLVVPRLPMLEVMPRLDAVVCQAGQSTVNEALLHGVPMVVAPIRLAEPIVADQVIRAGAGVGVSVAESTPQQIAAAVTAVLDEPGYRARARAVGQEYQAAGGTRAAAARLAALAAGSGGTGGWPG